MSATNPPRTTRPPDQPNAWHGRESRHQSRGPYESGPSGLSDLALSHFGMPTSLLHGEVRVAFLGRTSTEEQQYPRQSLIRQLDRSRSALPSVWVIVAHFYDVESGRPASTSAGRARTTNGSTSPSRATAASRTSWSKLREPTGPSTSWCARAASRSPHLRGTLDRTSSRRDTGPDLRLERVDHALG
jgi:hypothetical protein